MPFSRRTFLGSAAAAVTAATVLRPTLAAAQPIWPGGPSLPEVPFGGFPGSPGGAIFRERLTGADMPPAARWGVAGTDWGVPYHIDGHDSVAFLFGDTFSKAFPEDPDNDWRSPVMLRSPSQPGNGIVFDSAGGVTGDGRAPDIMFNGHNSGGEVTVIPNDGFTIGGHHVISYMSIGAWNAPNALWRTNYAGLAVSDNGNSFQRTGFRNNNNGNNTDPFQTWSMQREDDFVYFVSCASGRQNSPMMLRRSRAGDITDGNAHELWSGTWGRNPCTPLFTDQIGEPSLRKLGDTWVLGYLRGGDIVTRTAPRPEGPWSFPKVQVTQAQEANCYGGFIHPWSTPGNLTLMVSTWRRTGGRTTAYHVSRYQGSA